MDRRRLIGVLALLLLLCGVWHAWARPASYAWQPVAAGCLRVGLLLLAVWLAYAELQRVPSWLWGTMLCGLVLIAWRPRLAVVLLPIFGLMIGLRALGRRRQPP